MAKGNSKISYDLEEDILSLSRERKIQASIEIGDFIIDVDMNGFVAGIEILNASKNLNLSEEQLTKLEQASMHVTYKPNYVYILLIMKWKDGERDISIPLSLDLKQGITDTAQFAIA